MSMEISYQDFSGALRREGESMKSIGEKWQMIKDGEADPENFLPADYELDEEEASDNNTHESQAEGEEDSTNDSPPSEDSSDSSAQASSGEEETITFSEALEADEEEEESGEDSASSDTDNDVEETAVDVEPARSGAAWDDSINQAWGMIWASDKEVNTAEWEEASDKAAAIAEKANLGTNLEWYIEENFMKRDEEDPKSALIMSLIMAFGMTLPQRPEVMKKIKGAFTQDYDRGGNSVEDSEEVEA